MTTSKVRLGHDTLTLLERLYLKKREDGKVIETPEQFFRRVAHIAALAELRYTHKSSIDRLLKRYGRSLYDFFWLATRTKDLSPLASKDKELKRVEEDFYSVLSTCDFLPSSTVLLNSGKKIQQLFGSFALPLEDSIDSLFSSMHMSTKVHHTGAGVGLSFSKLRPIGDTIQTTGGYAAGPLSFVDMFDAVACRVSGGGIRSGLSGAVIRVDHPDIESFITAKKNGRALGTFNLTVALTDRFMQAFQNGTTYPLIHPRTGKIVKREDAHRVFRLLCESLWACGSPDVLFIDEVNRSNPTPKLGTYETVSPCGAVPLISFEACPLGSVNLSHMVKNDAVDWERLKKAVWLGVRFLDNIIDVSDYLFPEVAAAVHSNRSVALSVMGFADMLFQLRIRYSSDAGLRLAEDVMTFVNEEAKKASIDLARMRGVFPHFSKSIYSKNKKEGRVRNATRTALSPSFMTSVLAGCSHGVEPLFSVVHLHQIPGGDLSLINEHFVDAVKKEGVYTDALLKTVGQLGTLKGTFIPVSLKKLFVTASEVSPEWHIRMQAAFQKHCDGIVSMAASFPVDTPVEEVMKSCIEAYKLKCKRFAAHRVGAPFGQARVFGTLCSIAPRLEK